MPARHYDSRLLRDWWATIEERPDDRLLIGTFADFLAEREHPIAVAMRWAFDKNRRPHLTELQPYGETSARWYWVRTDVTVRSAMIPMSANCKLPKWMFNSVGHRRLCMSYESCTSAWQNFCRRFVARMPKIGRNAAFFCEAVP